MPAACLVLVVCVIINEFLAMRATHLLNTAWKLNSCGKCPPAPGRRRGRCGLWVFEVLEMKAMRPRPPHLWPRPQGLFPPSISEGFARFLASGRGLLMPAA